MTISTPEVIKDPFRCYLSKPKWTKHVRLHLMLTRLLVSVALLAISSASVGADWRSEIGRKVDDLVTQLNDGCSSEVERARKLYQFGNGDDQIFAALVSIEGYHCGNGNTEYLAVYRTGYMRSKTESQVSAKTLWLSAVATVGGRGERMVDFETLKWRGQTFTLNAMVYNHDAMCCPSVPVVLRYKLSFFGLSELQPNNSYMDSPCK